MAEWMKKSLRPWKMVRTPLKVSYIPFKVLFLLPMRELKFHLQTRIDRKSNQQLKFDITHIVSLVDQVPCNHCELLVDRDVKVKNVFFW